MTKWILYAAVASALGAGAWTVYRTASPDADDQRLTELRQLQLPPAGAARYAFLKREIPDVVSQVTCSCCGKKLIQCYQGACPLDCGPCNEQGKQTYEMYSHGKTVKQIQRYMAKHHPVSPGVRPRL